MKHVIDTVKTATLTCFMIVITSVPIVFVNDGAIHFGQIRRQQLGRSFEIPPEIAHTFLGCCNADCMTET
jgi:hypothetical protein